MTPKKEQNSFRSLRIIGKKAQEILENARNAAQRGKQSQPIPRLPKGEPMANVIVHVNALSVAKIGFVILAIAMGTMMIYKLRGKIVLLLLAMFLAAVIDPSVNAMQRRGVPRPLAVLILYFVAIFLLLFLVVSFIPIIGEQLQGIGNLLSTQIDAFLISPTIQLPLLPESTNQQLTVFLQTWLQDLKIVRFTDAMQQLGKNLSAGSAAQQSVLFAVGIAQSVLRFVMSLAIVLVLTFFIQMEKEWIIRWSISFLPHPYRQYLRAKAEIIHSKIAQWARGQLLLCFSIFLLTLIALLILRMEYALTLAVLAGFCEIIPAIGPFIAAVPAVLIATTKEGFIWAFIMIGVYYAIQWCENNLLVPLVMKRAIGLSPIAILFAMMVGISFPETLHPVLGVMLAIPAATIISIFLEDWQSRGSDSR